MTQPSHILGRVHEATWGLHADAERDRLVILNRATRWGYEQYLAALYGFEAPVESAYARTPGMASSFDLRATARAGLLAQDLIDLGVPAARVAHLPMSTAATSFEGLPEALGWRYALERSAQHRTFLRHRLLHILPRELSRAGRYLASGRDEAWAELDEALERTATSEAEVARVIAAARAAFAAQRAWFRRSDERIVELAG